MISDTFPEKKGKTSKSNETVRNNINKLMCQSLFSKS